MVPDDTEATRLPLYEEEDVDAAGYRKGSAQVALDIDPPFDEYLFIEKDPTFADELRNTLQSRPGMDARATIERGDANTVLVQWTARTNWHTHRAVVFLDPYGMQVEWPTLEALAATKAVDLWLLFPLGQGVNRLLMRKGPPAGSWGDRLTTVFGTEEWRSAFYRPSGQGRLFDDEPSYEKTASAESISQFFLDRLASIFEAVAPKPLVLLNSKRSPIFILCFAAANKKGAPTAVKIARDLIEGR